MGDPALASVSTVEAPTGRTLAFAKMVIYFALLSIGVRILQEIFKEISGTAYFGERSRLSRKPDSDLEHL